MSERQGPWITGELIAYTEREGPGRPPAASPTWAMGTLAGVLAVTFIGMVSVDTLCAEHRVWVEVLGSVGLVAMIGALVALVRGSAAAPVLTLLASSLGVGIGLVDAVHSATRGRLIVLGFAVALALAAAVSVRSLRLLRWDRTVGSLATHRPDALIRQLDREEPASTPAPAEAVPDDRSTDPAPR